MNDEKSIEMTDMTDMTDTPDAASTPLPAPRIRWAAVVWGLVLAGIAATALWIVSASERREAFVEWMLSLSVSAAVAYAVLAVGALVLVGGLVGMTRRAQRASEAAHAAE